MQMDVPVASFNLGAQAEHLAGYPRGCVLSSMDAGVVLDELLPFHRRLADAALHG